MGKKPTIVDNLSEIKMFIFTVEEYMRFSKFFANEDSKDNLAEKQYISVQTRLMLLRKYEANSDGLYLKYVLKSAWELFPENVQDWNIFQQRLKDLEEEIYEISLSDGTAVSMHESIEDVLYGLYLHGDKAKIEHLLKTEMNTYLFVVQRYVDTLEKLVIDLYSQLLTCTDDVYVRENHGRASIIFTGNDLTQEKEIQSSPYWANLRGRDASDGELKNSYTSLSEEDQSVLAIAVGFISELQKESYSEEKLKKMLFPSCVNEKSSFRYLHNSLAKLQLGFSTKVRYREDHKMAYVLAFNNVPGNSGFIIDQPQFSNDIWYINMVYEKDSWGWRVFSIGEKEDDYKMTGTLLDWLKYNFRSNK